MSIDDGLKSLVKERYGRAARAAQDAQDAQHGEDGQDGQDRQEGRDGQALHDVQDGEAARRVETSTRLIVNATSLGGVTSVMESRHRWEGERVPTGLLRLSVGLEDADALWDDLAGALEQIS